MQRLVFDRDYAGPPKRIFDQLAEHENLAPVLRAKIVRINDGTDGHRNGVGSARRLKLGPLPSFVETVTEFVPEELIRYRITEGSPLRDHEGVMRFTATPAGTHLHYEVTFDAAPVLDVVIAALLRRNISAGLRDL
jgi:hypothetical protein